MLVLSRRPSESGAAGSKVIVEGRLVIALERADERTVKLRCSRDGQTLSVSRVPFGSSIRFPDLPLAVFPIEWSGLVVRLGFEAPLSINIVRDDVTRLRSVA